MFTLSNFEEQGKSKFGDAGWFSPEFGENRIRVLSEKGETLPSHYVNATKKTYTCYGKDKGCPHDIWIDAVIYDKETNEPVMEIDGKTKKTERKLVHKPGLKYLLWIIDRKDEKMKIGKFTWGVIKAISDLKTNEEYKYDDAPPYDVIVKRTKTGPKPTDVEYSVIPARLNTPLIEAEIEMAKSKGNLEQIVARMKDKARSTKGPSEIGTDVVAPAGIVTNEAPTEVNI